MRKIFKYITVIMAVIWAVSVCAVDSASAAPLIWCAVSGAWLGMYVFITKVGENNALE